MLYHVDATVTPYSDRGYNMNKTKVVFVALFLSLALAVCSSIFAAQPPAPAPEAQPEMTAALEHLRAAKQSLESASHDKGGHRAKAIRLVNDAIAQVEQGIQYDNAHREHGEKH
jgi:hypothetical protein